MIPERVQKMADQYKSGDTLQKVGDTHGISRERIRQLLAQYGFMGRHYGGISREAVLAALPGTREEVAGRLGVSRARLSGTVIRHQIDPSFFDKAPGNPQKYSDWELLDHLRQVASRLDRTPGVLDVILAKGPSHVLYYTRFGSLTKAQEMAGLTPNKAGHWGHRKNR